MKIKILAARYVVWVVLGALVAALLGTVYMTMMVRDTNLDDLRADIEKSDKKIQSLLVGDEVIPQSPITILADLRQNVEHLPVIDDYRRNPFLEIYDRVWPVLLQVADKSSMTIPIKGARIVEVLPPLQKQVETAFVYTPGEGSEVTFKGLEATGSEVAVRLRDDMEQVYRFRISVLKVPEAREPNPPQEPVALYVRAAREMGLARREPAMALIIFQPDNRPIVNGQPKGPSTAANVYRKVFDAPDSDYVCLTRVELTRPVNEAQARAIFNRFHIAPPEAVGGPALLPAAPGPDGALIPQLAPGPDEAPRAFAVGEALQGVPIGAFAYLDDKVDDGESYVYKIETISEIAGGKPKACRKELCPIVGPAEIPTVVRIDLISVTGSSANMRLSRLDPDDGQVRVHEVRVAPGMFIGGRIPKYLVDIGPPAVYKSMDFSTGCLLVDVFSRARKVDYRLPLTTDSKGAESFRPRLVTNDQGILYLTPQGALRWKGKVESDLEPER